MTLKLYPNEYYDQQKEKHNAYIKAGFKLTSQRENKDGTIIRKYEKKI